MAVSKYDIELDLAKQPGTSHAFLVTMVGANKRVLDIGCDTGYLGEQLAAFGNVTSGFESNHSAADVARTRYNRVEVGDLETVDLAVAFGHASFDVVVFGDVLEHLRDPLPVLRQARGLVAPGGCVLISVPNIAHGDVRLALLHGQFRYTKTGLLDDTHTRFFTKASLVDFVHDAGFTMIELRRTRAELFKTEVGVREADFDPRVVDALRTDPEATTYQFVVRVVPDDAVQVSSQQAILVDALTTQLDEQRRLVRELRARESALATRVAELAKGPSTPAPNSAPSRQLAARAARRARRWTHPSGRP
ncbi:MAG: class I SAM-dependent methyltransferase [Jatrophihabitans sp.]